MFQPKIVVILYLLLIVGIFITSISDTTKRAPEIPRPTQSLIL